MVVVKTFRVSKILWVVAAALLAGIMAVAQCRAAPREASYFMSFLKMLLGEWF